MTIGFHETEIGLNDDVDDLLHAHVNKVFGPNQVVFINKKFHAELFPILDECIDWMLYVTILENRKKVISERKNEIKRIKKLIFESFLAYINYAEFIVYKFEYQYQGCDMKYVVVVSQNKLMAICFQEYWP